MNEISDAFNSSSTIPAPSARLGWQDSPDRRGTLDIVWSCVFSILLCLWTMLHLNVPTENDTYITIFWRKMRWLILGILAPELPMLFACGQYASAKRSVEDFRSLGYSEEQWTLCHAFYADSGGFKLQTEDFQAFPITAKQLHYLVNHRYVSLPAMSRDEIWDKSKADGVAKTMAFSQSGWLIAQTIGRGVQRLPITPFEISSLALICSSMTTLWFWWHKPLDVRTATVLDTTASVVDILREGGEAAKEPFLDTPLDFIEGRVYMSSKWSRHVLRWIRAVRLQKRPLDRIPNDRDPQANLRQHCLLGIGTATFASVHLAGWPFEFATRWEQALWRGGCIGVWVLLCLYGSTEMAVCYRENYEVPGLESGKGYKMRWPHCLLFFVPATLYFMARVGLLVVTMSSLASLPEGAYQTVQWSDLLPHL
ncbi:uncharacterized protein LTR77_002866 [Saxophila tyrrhenica]|uniref:Uncharacterized protein n=1 Tax=Saxophila tyrrhenica TaxID=1690608 RepID=A0AAV9PFU7_9PEZI|nr:hypothetical protein LTR77_002866 [Saxophila tyrrhenica]